MKKLATSVLLGCFCGAAWANTPFAQNEQARQQQQFQQQQRDVQQRWLEEHQYQTQHSEQPLTDLAEQCLPFDQIAFIGVSLIDPTPFAPKPQECLNERRLNQLSRDLTAAYLAEGYVHNPFRFENDGSRTLRVAVTEGKVRSLKTESKRLNLATLFPNLIGKPLNVKQLDQGLDQANRMAGVSASVDVLPDTSGQLDLIFSNQDQPALSGAIGLNNDAVKKYGEWQLQGELNGDNLLGLSDSLFLAASSTLKDHHKNTTRSVSLYHRIPYGNWGFSTFAALSASEAELPLPTQTAQQKSKNRQFAFKADYLLHRGTNHISTLAGQLERIENRSYFNDALLALQSPKLTTAQLQVSHLHLFSWGSLGANISYERGLSWFNATPNQGRDQPEGQFNKWNFALQLQHFHRWYAQNFLFEHQLLGQYSRNYLAGVKQAELLGEYAVRGFKELSSSAEKQLLLKNKLAWLYQKQQWQLAPYLALDLGVQKASTEEIPSRKAIGYGAGVSWTHASKISADVSYAKGKLFGNGVALAQKEHNWRFSLTIPF